MIGGAQRNQHSGNGLVMVLLLAIFGIKEAELESSMVVVFHKEGPNCN